MYQPNLSIVLPCYNEEKNIVKNVQNIIRTIKSQLKNINFEIILVNDGSKDKTYESLLKAEKKFKWVFAHTYEKNMWKWYAIKYGLSKTRWEIVWFIDSDWDIDPQHIVDYYNHIIQHHDADIVIGSKTISGSVGKASIKRKILSYINMKINSLLFNLPVKDTQVGVKFFRKEVKQIIENFSYTYSYAFDVEFLFFAHYKGFKIKELPVRINTLNRISTIDTYASFKILYDLLILHKKINYLFYLKKQETKKKTKLKLFVLKFFIFPWENIIRFLLKNMKNKKNTLKQGI